MRDLIAKISCVLLMHMKDKNESSSCDDGSSGGGFPLPTNSTTEEL